MSTPQEILETYTWSYKHDDTHISTVNFNKGFIHVSACAGSNSQGSSYTVNNDASTISFSIGRTTMMMPPPDVAKIERIMGGLFSGSDVPFVAKAEGAVGSFQIKDFTLTGAVKFSVKYGAPTRVFFDVKVPTGGVYNADNTGYTVREVGYDDNAIPRTYGEWFVLKEAIQGFQPQPNHEYQIRVNKYTDAATGENVYVHDMNVVTSYTADN